MVACATNAPKPTPMDSRRLRGWLRSTSIRGERVGLARAASAKTGVSATRARTNRPMASSTMLRRNGIRQPQARNSASPVREADRASTSVESTTPVGAPALVKLVHRPRREEACSADISAAPPHSPPTAMPCTTRRSTSRIGAHTPTWA